MKAIKITQEIKDKNAKYGIHWVNTGAVGEYVKRNLPNKFHVTEPVSGYYHTRTDLHEADGWRDIIMPTIDERTQEVDYAKIIEVIENNEVVAVTHGVKEKTQDEIDNYDQAQLDADAQANKVQQRIADGNLQFQRLMAIIERKYINGDFSSNATTNKNVALAVIEYFYNALLPITQGVWVVAQKNLSEVPQTSNTQAINLYNAVKSEVDQYVNQTYAKI